MMTDRGWTLAIAVALLAACGAPVDVIDPGPDGGPPQADAGPPVVADAGLPDIPDGLPPGTVGGSICDQQDHCDSCRACSHAPRETCNDLALSCEATPTCQALASCVIACGSEECARGCVEDHRAGLEQLLGLLRCEVCDACPRDCAEHASICEGGDFVPF